MAMDIPINEAVDPAPVTPLGQASMTAYVSFRQVAKDAITSSADAGHSKLAGALQALLPLADYRVEQSSGESSMWPIRSAVSEVVDEARKSLEALNRVAPDAGDDEASNLLALRDVYADVVERGDNVMRAFNKDEEQARPVY